VSEGTSDEDGPSGVYWLLLAPLCRLQRPVSATAPMHLHASPAFCFARPLHGNSSASSTLSHPWPTTSSSSLTVRAHPIRQPKCLFYLLSLVPLPASSSSSSASTCPYPTSSSTFSPPHDPWPLALHLKTPGCLHAHRRVFKVLAAHATPTSDVLSSLGLRPQATLNSGSVSQWHRPLSPVRLLPSGAPPLASTSSTFARELSDSPGLCPSLLLKASCF